MKLLKKSDYTISEKGISQIETIPIGGINQSILIQTEKPGSPVLLFIHGGPSMPVPGVSNRGTDYTLVMNTKELIKHFTVVFWDQRGTGKSFSKDIPKETMQLKQFINDARDVTDYLRSRFKQDKLHLAAHSWGSVIGLSLASKYPEKYYSYTGFSQITSWVENDKLSYKWLIEMATETNNKQALAELAAVGEPPYTKDFKQWAVIRKWQLKYRTMFYDAGDKKSATFFSGLKIMLRSPDYSLMDIYNSLVRGFKLSYTDEMIHDINTFDFFSEVPALNVPVMFIHGSKEKHVLPELITRYFEVLDAPKGKSLYWSEKSSHAFHLDDARENEQRLIRHLLEAQHS
ncbi:alpha/beta fold hydrolase [Neobacillus citreus]|uniref:Alpha/beta hydrolase n=1 Tax=Neobacillus citreus TaxID=2833578 RepID=A0A942T767_9BACI|nr:alpha/beta hydrolase [Neobacillus citreus]MCH6264554.1 alpha/beta hydrolase [Neobacillus citreus]